MVENKAQPLIRKTSSMLESGEKATSQVLSPSSQAMPRSSESRMRTKARLRKCHSQTSGRSSSQMAIHAPLGAQQRLSASSRQPAPYMISTSSWEASTMFESQ